MVEPTVDLRESLKVIHVINSDCPQVQTDMTGSNLFGDHLVIVHRTKLLFKLGQEIGKSNSCMKWKKSADK